MKPTTEQLYIINSRLPGTKLGSENIEVLPFRVFDNAVTDRFTIMSKEMMMKVAKDLNEGKAAFNKLHQSRETLPVGRSVNAKMMLTDEQRREVHANMYAVVKNLDGTTAVDGKDLVDKYNTGSVFACSAGVQVGFYKCNICGNDIRDWQNCEHSLGKFYTVDEQPKQCMALMTGRDIQDGMAMDCGIYEVSAVTAGGVANAGVLTEAFEKYAEGTDIGEFKKTTFADTKDINARITFEAMHVKSSSELNEERKPIMALEEKDVQKLIDAQFGTIVADKAKLEVEHKHLEDKFNNLTSELTTAKTSIDVLTAEYKTKEEALIKEKDELKANYEVKETEFKAEKDAFTAEKEALEAFKQEYISSVFAAGNKIGKTDALTVYAEKSLEELKTLMVEYANELNVQFPSGRQSTDAPAETDTYCGIPESVFKTDK